MLSFAAFCRHLASSDPASTPSSPTSLMMPVITSSSRRSTLRPTPGPPRRHRRRSTLQRAIALASPLVARALLCATGTRHYFLFPATSRLQRLCPLPATARCATPSPYRVGPPPTCHGPHQVTTGPLRHRAANASTATPPSPFYLPPPSSPLPYLSCLSPPNLLSPYLPPPSPSSPSMPARRRRTCRRPACRHRL